MCSSQPAPTVEEAMSQHPPLTRAAVEQVRNRYRHFEPVQGLAAEVERLRRELTDAKANLETLLMGWRHHHAHDSYGAITAVVHRLDAVLCARDANDDEITSAMLALSDEFERGE
jgi:hypothetical protein